MSGGFPVDLILFAMVAAFLVLRLRSVLGRRTGFERPPQAGDKQEGDKVVPLDSKARRGNNDMPELPAAIGQSGPSRRTLPDTRSPMGLALTSIRGIDPTFDPNPFLDGAEGAFRMIVDAFARGDRQTLRALLADETYGGFEGAITVREQNGESQRSEVRAMQDMGIDAAELRGTVADVTVRFVSDQVNMTMARDGSVAAGAEAVTELTDIWTFQRDLSSQDPTWRLVATRSA